MLGLVANGGSSSAAAAACCTESECRCVGCTNVMNAARLETNASWRGGLGCASGPLQAFAAHLLISASTSKGARSAAVRLFKQRLRPRPLPSRAHQAGKKSLGPVQAANRLCSRGRAAGAPAGASCRCLLPVPLAAFTELISISSCVQPMEPLDVLCNTSSFWFAQNPAAPLDLGRFGGTKRQTIEWLLQQRCVGGGRFVGSQCGVVPRAVSCVGSSFPQAATACTSVVVCRAVHTQQFVCAPEQV